MFHPKQATTFKGKWNAHFSELCPKRRIKHYLGELELVQTKNPHSYVEDGKLDGTIGLVGMS
jgi:hypothetical protein